MAQALRAALPQAAVECHDLLADVPAWLRWAYPRTYYLLVRHLAKIWGTCFEWLDRQPIYLLAQPIRRAWNLVMAHRFIARLRRQPPDLVVATHFFPADVCSACKALGWLQAPLVIVITDLHPHRFWLSRPADAYVCATQHGLREATARGMAVQQLHAIGIPISAQFLGPIDRAASHALFQLEPNRRTVLVTSGGSTVGPFEAVVEALMSLETALPNRLQLLVICGDNASVAQRLCQRVQRAPMPVRVLGFIETMPQAMAVSDVVVAKAGGLTVMEALGLGVPLVLYHAIPGQERFNAEHVATHGAAVMAHHPDEAAAAVRRLLEDSEHWTAMHRAALALSTPDAAHAIVARVIQPLLHRVAPPHA